MNNYKFNFVIKNVLLYIVVFLAVFSILSKGSLCLSTKNDNSAPIILDQGWQFRYGNSPVDNSKNPVWVSDDQQSSGWHNFQLPCNIPLFVESKDVWLRIKLPDNYYNDPCLQFTHSENFLKAYIDTKLIYDKSTNIQKKDTTNKYPWYLVDLPTEYIGEFLYVNIKSPSFIISSQRFQDTQIGNRDDIVSNRNYNLLKIIKNELPYIILSGFFIFIGVLLQLTFFARKFARKSYYSLGFSCSCIGIWIASNTNLIEFSFNSSTFWFYIGVLVVELAPIGFYIFVENTFEVKYKNIFKWFSRLNLTFIIVTFVLDALDILPISLTVLLFYCLFVFFSIFVLYLVIKDSNTKDFEVKIFSFGLTTLSLTIVFDIYMIYNLHIHIYQLISPFGLFLFILLLIYILGRQYVQAYTKLDTYSEEIKLKTQSLIENKRLLDEAIEYDKLKNEFLANISHELRTPLNIILGSLQLFNTYLKGDNILNFKGSIIKHINAMQQNCYRLIRLVNNLIDSTKIDSGYLDINLTNCDIISLVENITLSTSEYVKSKGMSLCFDTDIEEKVLACDADKIERIVLNLLSNAVKFSKIGDSIMVTITDMDSDILISVEDTGIGIPSDKLDIIFERFRQVDKSLTRNFEGSGIGLSLVKSLVEMHNGKISVESNYGKGTKFFVKLPVKITENSASNIILKNGTRQSLVEKISIEFSDIYS